jgi:hypothetical protein
MLSALLLTLPLAKAPALASTPHGEFTAPEGFKIVSFSPQWDEAKLQELYRELKNNKTGPELYLLKKIIIHPQADQVAAGSFLRRDREWQVETNIPGFLPPKLIIRRKVGVIELYNGDRRNTVAHMARTLSHEYGHHFTYYHFLGGAREQEYLSLRQLAQFPRVAHYHPLGRQLYLDNHDWDISELAAEDYVQLMGSPLARATAPVLDIGEMLAKTVANPGTSDRVLWENQKIRTLDAGNVTPQHNFFLPLAWEVSGLEQWFLGFLELEPPQRPWANTSRPELSFTRETLRNNGKEHSQYRFSWTRVEDSPDTLYTLVAFDDESGHRQPIRTVSAHQEQTALVGTALVTRGSNTFSWNDNLLQGTRHFQVYVTFPDGSMTSSGVLTLHFDGPPRPDPATVRIIPPRETKPLGLQADLTTASARGKLVVNLAWQGEFSSSGLALAQAIAITESPAAPDFWSWQPSPSETVITFAQPGTWYIHYFGKNQTEVIQGTLGPYRVESRIPAWLKRLLTFLRIN